MKDLKELPTPEKKVAAKVLTEHKYTLRGIENVLGIDHSTAAYYKDEPVPEELKEFSTIFDNYLTECEKKGIVMVAERILDLIPEEKRIDQLVKAGEYFKGNNQNPSSLTQINIDKGNEISFVNFKDESKS